MMRLSELFYDKCLCWASNDELDDWAYAEIARLTSERDELRGRVSELESAFAGASDLLMRIHNALHYGEIYQWNDGRECWKEMDDFAEGYVYGAWLLRKQAEAVEAAISKCSDDAYNWHVTESVCRTEGLKNYAQRLRAQADAAEKPK